MKNIRLRGLVFFMPQRRRSKEAYQEKYKIYKEENMEQQKEMNNYERMEQRMRLNDQNRAEITAFVRQGGFPACSAAGNIDTAVRVPIHQHESPGIH